MNEDGIIQGHQHVVVQKMDEAKGPLDPSKFDFFKGLDQNPDAKTNDLSVKVEKGLTAGEYRICTITGTVSHQPVIMPVAQRGAQDDCIRINVQ